MRPVVFVVGNGYVRCGVTFARVRGDVMDMEIKITINIGDKKFELTVEELRQLFMELSKFFKFETAPVYRNDRGG